jgi:hypothetical protein
MEKIPDWIGHSIRDMRLAQSMLQFVKSIKNLGEAMFSGKMESCYESFSNAIVC